MTKKKNKEEDINWLAFAVVIAIVFAVGGWLGYWMFEPDRQVVDECSALPEDNCQQEICYYENWGGSARAQRVLTCKAILDMEAQNDK